MIVMTIWECFFSYGKFLKTSSRFISTEKDAINPLLKKKLDVEFIQENHSNLVSLIQKKKDSTNMSW